MARCGKGRNEPVTEIMAELCEITERQAALIEKLIYLLIQADVPEETILKLLKEKEDDV